MLTRPTCTHTCNQSTEGKGGDAHSWEIGELRSQLGHGRGAKARQVCMGTAAVYGYGRWEDVGGDRSQVVRSAAAVDMQ